MSGKGNGIIMWAGADATNGNAHIKSGERNGGIEIGTIGFNQDGAFDGNVYHWNGQSWADTGQTVAGFYGV